MTKFLRSLRHCIVAVLCLGAPAATAEAEQGFQDGDTDSISSLADVLDAGSFGDGGATRLLGVRVSPDLKSYQFVRWPHNVRENVTAFASFQDSLMEIGWGVLEVRTNGDAAAQYDELAAESPAGQTAQAGHAAAAIMDDSTSSLEGVPSLEQQGYAAGLLEGYLTGERMRDNIENLWEVFQPGGRSNTTQLWSWLRKQDAFARQKVAWLRAAEAGQQQGQQQESQQQAQQEVQLQAVQDVKDGERGLWRHTSFLLAQFDGLKEGYRARNKLQDDEQLWRDMTLVNAVGDLLDLNATLVQDPGRQFYSWNGKEYREDDLRALKQWLETRGMCSAIFKLNPEGTDISYGHSSWFSFSATNRIYKHYHFLDHFFAAKSTSFSSYAGYLSSLDDFYLMSSGLTMIQTSLAVLDPARRANTTQDSLLAWQRVRAANALARTGPEWAQLLGKYNSGTYNNQYMVLDLNKFEPGRPLPPETFHVTEQIPQLVVHADVTKTLGFGYYGSFNEPFFREVFQQAGYAAYVEKTGDYEETFALAPRANIFRRDAGTADGVDGAFNILRSNFFKTDALSKGNPMKAICSRGDLQGVSGGRNRTLAPSGCYDTKASSVGWTRNRQRAVVVSGPTRNREIPAFRWSAFPDLPQKGLPKEYTFKPVTMEPKLVNVELLWSAEMRGGPGNKTSAKEAQKDGDKDGGAPAHAVLV